MISLLPPDDKKNLRAARSNTLLVRYAFALVGLVIAIAIEVGFVYMFLANEQRISEASIEENQRKSVEFAEVKKQAATFSNDLKIAESIIDKQAPYAAILREFSNTMPPGAVVDRIAIDPETLGKPTQLTIRGKNYSSILAFKDAFNQSEYFSDAKILSITEAPLGEERAKNPYPTTASVEVIFNKELLNLENPS